MSADLHTRLDQLPPHTCARVMDIEAPGDDMARLMSMGICRGRMVELIQRGDPLILKVYGSRIGVSQRLAHRILVDSCDHEHCPTQAKES